jgi:hypothetical protein
MSTPESEFWLIEKERAICLQAGTSPGVDTPQATPSLPRVAQSDNLEDAEWNSVIGVFASGDPNFAAQHDEIYQAQADKGDSPNWDRAEFEKMAAHPHWKQRQEAALQRLTGVPKPEPAVIVARPAEDERAYRDAYWRKYNRLVSQGKLTVQDWLADYEGRGQR